MIFRKIKKSVWIRPLCSLLLKSGLSKIHLLLLQSIELGVEYAPKHLEKPVPHFPMTSRLQNGKSLDFPQTYSRFELRYEVAFRWLTLGLQVVQPRITRILYRIEFLSSSFSFFSLFSSRFFTSSPIGAPRGFSLVNLTFPLTYRKSDSCN